MSVWRNHIFDISVDWRKRKYMIDHLGVEIISDFMNKDTNRMITLVEWRKFVKIAERARTGVRPDNLEVLQKADDIFRVAHQIPREVRVAMRNPYRITPSDNDKVYLIRNGQEFPGIWSNNRLHLVWIDQVGEHHVTGKTTRKRQNDEFVRAQMWFHLKEWQKEWGDEEEEIDERWVGPRTTSHPNNVRWCIHEEKEFLGGLTIKTLTRAQSDKKFKPPPSKEAWRRRRMRGIDYDRVWRIRSFFTTPRDQVTWLK
eukprot:2921239-Prymnesium_polylepis.1